MVFLLDNYYDSPSDCFPATKRYSATFFQETFPKQIEAGACFDLSVLVYLRMRIAFNQQALLFYRSYCGQCICLIDYPLLVMSALCIRLRPVWYLTKVAMRISGGCLVNPSPKSTFSLISARAQLCRCHYG